MREIQTSIPSGAMHPERNEVKSKGHRAVEGGVMRNE